MTIEPVQARTRVALIQPEAFDAFTRSVADWWPLAFTMSGDRLARVRVDPEGREWFEEDLDGGRTTWGEITAWNAPHGFDATFAISPRRTVEPAERRSEVAFRFVADGLHTIVRVEHGGWERHGEGAQAMRDGMASGQGWPLILAEFAREARRRAGA